MSLIALSSIILATTPVTAIPDLPDDLNSVPEARWTKQPRSNEITSRKAERLMKANGCTSLRPTDTWEGMKVVVLMLVDKKGKVKQMTPVANGCEAVEKYGAKHLAKHLDKFVSRARNGQPTWYRAKIIYSW